MTRDDATGHAVVGVLRQLDRVPQVRHLRHRRLGRKLPLLGQGLEAAAQGLRPQAGEHDLGVQVQS